MTRPARVLHATLDLLDRQLRDRDGRLCGNVDDLEIERHDDGTMYVTAILTGPGVLAYRLGARRFGRWLQRANGRLHDDDQQRRTRVPIELAHSIGPAIDLAVDADDLANHDAEQWALDHVIGRIPGSASRARQ